MANTRLNIDKIYKLVMTCRQSGMSDKQWCTEHAINPSTFYYWIKKLCNYACYDIPENSYHTGVKHAPAPIAKQRQLISSLRVALDTSNTQTAELTAQIKLLNEQLEYMKKKLFGTSSEKSQHVDQLNLFNKVEQKSNPKASEPEEATLVNAHARKPKTKLQEKINDFPVETIEIALNANKQKNQFLLNHLCQRDL